MSFVEQANAVRKRIPFAYWLIYDLAVLPVVIVAVMDAWWAIPALLMFLVAVFFDVNEAFVKWHRRKHGKPIDLEYLKRDALIGEAYAARMLGDNPAISRETRQAYRWAESQFLRIAYGHVDERDLIG